MARKFARYSGITLCALALAAAAILAISGGTQNIRAQPPKGGGPPPPPKVLVAAAQGAEVADERSFVGTVWPVRRSTVGSAVPGRVEEYLINEGEAVTAGQPIARLRQGIIQAELNAAKAMLAVRQAELKELETSLADELDQAKAKLAIAQANLTYRRTKLQRSQALGTSISRELLEEDSSLATQASGAVLEAQAALRLLTDGARQQKTEQARASAEAQVAEVERLTEQFERHTMRAPFDGFVTAEHTEVGQWVMQGDPVAEIVELKQVEVAVAVLEDYIAQLDMTVVGRVEVPALPGQTFQGQVAVINPLADARARTFPVKVRIENQFVGNQPLLKAGMFARVTLPVGKPVNRTLVPKDAVVLGGQSPMLFIAAGPAEKAAVKPVPVKLGSATGSWIAVSGDVQPGDSIIVEGNERVRPGMEVRTEPKDVKLPWQGGTDSNSGQRTDSIRAE
jgi:RND family efflux transporter MFP subunit